MKKAFLCLLSLPLLLTSIGAYAEIVIFNRLPDSVADLELDLTHPIDNMVKGAWIEEVNLGDGTFDMYDYLPETSQVCEKAILIILESGVKADEFFVTSGWKEIADANNVSIMMVPNESAWTEEDAVAKVNAAFTAVKQRHYYDISWDLLDLVGYGDGATAAMQFTVSSPDAFAAVVLFGGDAVTAEYLETVGGQPSLEEGIAKNAVKCPVWVFAEEADETVLSEINYWKQANNGSDFVFSNEYADVVYMPADVYHGLQMDDWNIAQTRLTVGKYTDGTGVDLLQEVYDEFLAMYARHRGIGNQELRYYVGPTNYNMTLYTAEVDGMTRYWYVYEPDCVKNSSQPVPLVVSMAGRGGSNTTFPSLTDWPLIANERGFICAFPIAGYGQQLQNGVNNIPMWNSNVDDVAFIRYMVDDIKSHYNIDAGRVYANGQSMGSMMSMRLNVCLPDVFTATGSTCGALPSNALNSEYYNDQIDCAAWLIYGEKDTTVGSYKISESNSVKTCIEYYIERYNLTDVDHAKTYRSGPFSHYVFLNEQGVPMFRYSVVDNKGHANLPSESYMLYDDFFSKFYRDDAGVLHYMESDNVLDIH